MRNLPTSYRFNSTYALFPFNIPSRTVEALKSFGKLALYDTARPTPAPDIFSVRTYAACSNVLSESSACRRF